LRAEKELPDPAAFFKALDDMELQIEGFIGLQLSEVSRAEDEDVCWSEDGDRPVDATGDAKGGWLEDQMRRHVENFHKISTNGWQSNLSIGIPF